MKVCPQCDQSYQDDSLNYCLNDGAPLVATESQPTIVMPPTPATITTVMPREHRAKTGSRFWIVALVLVIVIGITTFAGILIYLYVSQNRASSTNRTGNANTTPTPKPTATPRPTPSPTASATPVSAETRPSPKNEEADEITPISWSTSASNLKTDVGQTYKFQCPEDGVPGIVWGSDIYTADSSICTAAVHAGIITLESGGVVTIEFRPGRSIYGSTDRHGIVSSTYGEYPHSFVVR